MRPPAVLVVLACLLTTACGLRAGGAPAVAAAECTGSDASTIREGTLTVGTDLAYPPFAGRDDDGSPSGFDVDVLREVATRSGLEVRFVDQAFPALTAGLLARRFDVVASAMTVTDERRAQVCFTEPYLPADLAVAVHESRADEVASSDDLGGADVGVESSSAGERWAQRHLAGRVGAITTFETSGDVFAALSTGSVAAVIVDAGLALHRQTARRSPVRVVERIETGDSYAIAVRPDGKALLDDLNGSLRAMREDGTTARIIEKWFGPS